MRVQQRKGVDTMVDFVSPIEYEVTSEEYYSFDDLPILCSKNTLPPARYIGGNEWVDVNGIHYLVTDND